MYTLLRRAVHAGYMSRAQIWKRDSLPAGKSSRGKCIVNESDSGQHAGREATTALRTNALWTGPHSVIVPIAEEASLA
jgi:hypothetical protein